MRKMKIEFLLPPESKETKYPPQPAKNFIPKKYKDLDGYTNNDLRAPTVKQCIPFLDAMTNGYIIPFHQDYLITVDYNKKEWDVRANFYSPRAHGSQQLPDKYQDGQKPVGKFANKWTIKTPLGYSCLFVHPMNVPKTDFEIIPGIIDTDIYDDAVLFPYYFRRYDGGNKENVQIHIKTGDPMVQVIPFKREKWKSCSGSTKNKNYAKLRDKWAGQMLNIYKKFYWRKKNYD